MHSHSGVQYYFRVITPIPLLESGASKVLEGEIGGETELIGTFVEGLVGCKLDAVGSFSYLNELEFFIFGSGRNILKGRERKTCEGGPRQKKNEPAAAPPPSNPFFTSKEPYGNSFRLPERTSTACQKRTCWQARHLPSLPSEI